MMKLLVCTFLFFAFVCANYDFKDSDFNQLIFDDLTIQSEPLRFKRDTGNDKECNRKKQKEKEEKDVHCCSGGQGNPEVLEAAKEVKKKCIDEIRGESDESNYDPLNCDGVQSMRQQMICAAECIAKNQDLLAANGDFKRDSLLNHTRSLIGQNKWKNSVLEEYVDACLKSLKAPKELRNSEDFPSTSCNPYPLEFHHCIWRKFVEGCPLESQIDSKKCRKLRDRLSNGDILHADKTFKKLLRPKF